MSLATLFRPNVEKMEKKKNIRGLIKALDYHKDETVRFKAAVALGKMRDPRAVEQLVHALQDESQTVRRQAAKVLFDVGDYRMVDALIFALKDKYYDLKEERVEPRDELAKDENRSLNRNASRKRDNGNPVCYLCNKVIRRAKSSEIPEVNPLLNQVGGGMYQGTICGSCHRMYCAECHDIAKKGQHCERCSGKLKPLFALYVK